MLFLFSYFQESYLQLAVKLLATGKAKQGWTCGAKITVQILEAVLQVTVCVQVLLIYLVKCLKRPKVVNRRGITLQWPKEKAFTKHYTEN